MGGRLKRVMQLALLTMVFIRPAAGQSLQYSVTYVAASSVFINAGKPDHVAVGDTLSITRNAREIGVVVVSAVNSKTSSAEICRQSMPLAAGDRAILLHDNGAVGGGVSPSIAVKQMHTDSSQQGIEKQPTSALRNAASGRISIQHQAIIAEQSNLSLQQPSLNARISIDNIAGTGVDFMMSEQNVYDASGTYSSYGKTKGMNTYVYDFLLQRYSADAQYGVSLGRQSSRFVGGMGAFDGVQVYKQFNSWTIGVLAGVQVVDRSVAASPEGVKGSVFVHYDSEDDIFHAYRATLGIGQEMSSGNLERRFLYLQNDLSLGTGLLLYQNAEVEMSGASNNTIVSAFHLSNIMMSVNYSPADWINTNMGYDAVRPVYSYETIKILPDSLIDRELYHALRLSSSFRLPASMTVSVNGSLQTGNNLVRGGYAFGASLRMNDLLYEISSGVKYQQSRGAYIDGKSYDLTVERSFHRDLLVTLRATYQSNDVPMLQQTYTTQIGGVDLYYMFTARVSASLNGEYVYDGTMNSVRAFIEAMYHF